MNVTNDIYITLTMLSMNIYYELNGNANVNLNLLVYTCYLLIS